MIDVPEWPNDIVFLGNPGPGTGIDTNTDEFG